MLIRILVTVSYNFPSVLIYKPFRALTLEIVNKGSNEIVHQILL